MNRDEFLKKLEIELKISKNSPYTIRNYIQANRELLDHCNQYPKDVSQDDIKLFIVEKREQASPASIILFLAAIKYAYISILNIDITQTIRRPKREKHLPTVLTKEEVKQLLSSINNKKSKLMISLVYACRLRVSELVSLEINNINIVNKTGMIKQSRGRKDHIFNIPIFLSDDLKDQIEKQKKQNQKHLFSGPKGKLSTRNIQKIVKNAGTKAGINKEVYTHILRHSFATHLLENDVGIKKSRTSWTLRPFNHSNLYTRLNRIPKKHKKSNV